MIYAPRRSASNPEVAAPADPPEGAAHAPAEPPEERRRPGGCDGALHVDAREQVEGIEEDVVGDEAEEPEDEEPQDWTETAPADDEDEVVEEAADDPGASRRFWFEHATGAGKTVAAVGFIEATRTGAGAPRDSVGGGA